MPRNPFLKFKIQYLHSIKKWSIELTPFLFCQSHTSINNENAEFNFSKFPLASLSNTSAHYLKKKIRKFSLFEFARIFPVPHQSLCILCTWLSLKKRQSVPSRASLFETAVKILRTHAQTRATPEKQDSQRVAKWPIVE